MVFFPRICHLILQLCKERSSSNSCVPLLIHPLVFIFSRENHIILRSLTRLFLTILTNVCSKLRGIKNCQAIFSLLFFYSFSISNWQYFNFLPLSFIIMFSFLRFKTIISIRPIFFLYILSNLAIFFLTIFKFFCVKIETFYKQNIFL